MDYECLLHQTNANDVNFKITRKMIVQKLICDRNSRSMSQNPLKKFFEDEKF